MARVIAELAGLAELAELAGEGRRLIPDLTHGQSVGFVELATALWIILSAIGLADSLRERKVTWRYLSRIRGGEYSEGDLIIAEQRVAVTRNCVAMFSVALALGAGQVYQVIFYLTHPILPDTALITATLRLTGLLMLLFMWRAVHGNRRMRDRLTKYHVDRVVEERNIQHEEDLREPTTDREETE